MNNLNFGEIWLSMLIHKYKGKYISPSIVMVNAFNKHMEKYIEDNYNGKLDSIKKSYMLQEQVAKEAFNTFDKSGI